MKAVIPAAGQGTRLYSQTHTTPEPIIRLAGRPILGHILDSPLEVGVTDAVIVIGTMKEQVIDYAERIFGDEMDLSFVAQSAAEGLGHAVYRTREAVGDEPLSVLLGDMLFENDVRGAGDEFQLTDAPAEEANAVVVPPVDPGDDVVPEECVVGPDVSVDHRARVAHSIVSNAIIGADSELVDVNLIESIVGANTVIEGQPKKLNVGDSSSVRL